MHRSATNIQRRVRGMLTRSAIVEYQSQRREFMRIREKQRPIRDSPVYRFMAYWGVAPFLRGSTTLEKVLLSYPVHMHDILSDCINEEYVSFKLIAFIAPIRCLYCLYTPCRS